MAFTQTHVTSKPHHLKFRALETRFVPDHFHSKNRTA